MSLAEIEAELLALDLAEDYYRSEHSFSHFIKAAWDVLEPGKEFLPNWHIDCIAEYLEAVASGQIKRLIINEPPRHMKSIQVTVCFPPWLWIKNPSKRIISASYSNSLSIKHNVDRRQIIESPWYRMAWGHRYQLAKDQNQKSEFMNDQRGHMVATSVGGTITGKGGDLLIADDPQNPKNAASDLERETANTWFDQTFSTRLDNKREGAIIVVMQRLHEKDLTGHLKDKAGWEHLSLPAEAPTKTTVVFPVSGRELVREEGALLWPEREGPKEIAQTKVDLGSAGFQGQYQQDPRPAAGGFFKRKWWQRFRELPSNGLMKVQFWDCAQVPGVTNDYSVCATWIMTPTGFYRKHLWREKVAYPDLKRAAKDLYAQEKPDAVVVENKAHGIALIQDLQSSTTIPIIPWPAEEAKMIRASRAQPTVEAGKCFIPEDDPLNEDFILEHENFPNGAHDDCVDTTSMMLDYFREDDSEPRIRDL